MALVVCMCAALMSEPVAPCFTMSCAMVALTWLELGFGFGLGFGLGLGVGFGVGLGLGVGVGLQG